MSSLLTLTLFCSSASLAFDAANFSDLLTASITRRRGSFWAVSQAANGTETRFASVGALFSARAPVGGPASLAYWAAQPASLEGVVGSGWAVSSPLDLAFSESFLGRLAAAQRGARLGGGGGGEEAPRHCLHVGAGIGRETGVLLSAGGCATVDLLEPHAHFMAAATRAVPPAALGATFSVAAEAHDFGAARYDLILLQWMTNYVSDGDLARVLARAAAALRAGGAVVVKDNVSEGADGVHSEVLHHLIRSTAYLDAIVEVGAPALVKVADEPQRPWVSGLFPVRAMAFVRRGEEGGFAWLEEAAVDPDSPA